MDDSLKSFATFIEWCNQANNSTMPDLLRSLQRQTIPTTQNFRTKAIRAIKSALRSLYLIIPWMQLSCIESKKDGYQDGIPGLVHKAWNGIWAWVSFLHTHCIVEKSLGKTLKTVSLHLIPDTVSSFGWHAGLRKSMIETPGFLTMFLRHWQEEDSYVNQPDLEWHERHFCLALEQLLLYRDEDKHVLDAIVNATEGGAETVSRIALDQLLDQLQCAKNGTTVHLDSLCFDLTIIKHLSAGSSSAALQPLLCRGLAPAIAKFLRLLHPRSTFGKHDTIPSVIGHCMIAAFSLISKILFLANGPVWVSQFIDAGLIPGILNSGRWLRHFMPIPDIPSAVAITVFGHLQTYLVYRSVLRSIRKTLKDVKRSLGDRGPSDPLWEAYFIFEKIALHRLKLKAMFDKESALGLEPGFLGCNNRDCSIRTDDVEFKRCSSCLRAVYCSKICQKNDWARHRGACKGWQTSLANGSCIKISEHDKNFLHYQAQSDFRTHAPLLMEHIRERYPSTPLSSLCIEICYTPIANDRSVWPVINIHLASSYQWQDDNEKRDAENMLYRVRSLGVDAPSLFAQVRVREGNSVRPFQIICPVPTVLV